MDHLHSTGSNRGFTVSRPSMLVYLKGELPRLKAAYSAILDLQPKLLLKLNPLLHSFIHIAAAPCSVRDQLPIWIQQLDIPMSCNGLSSMPTTPRDLRLEPQLPCPIRTRSGRLYKPASSEHLATASDKYRCLPCNHPNEPISLLITTPQPPANDSAGDPPQIRVDNPPQSVG